MSRFDTPSTLVFIVVVMTVANIAWFACYKGDPGYGLCSPGDETCTERSRDGGRE